MSKIFGDILREKRKEKGWTLQKQYEEKHGELPQWNSIDAVWEAVKQLRKELG